MKFHTRTLDTNSFGINDTNSFNIIDTFRNNAITQERKTDIQINNQYRNLEAYRARRRAANARDGPRQRTRIAMFGIVSYNIVGSGGFASPQPGPRLQIRTVQNRIPCAPASSSRDGPPNRTVRAR